MFCMGWKNVLLFSAGKSSPPPQGLILLQKF